MSIIPDQELTEWQRLTTIEEAIPLPDVPGYIDKLQSAVASLLTAYREAVALLAVQQKALSAMDDLRRKWQYGHALTGGGLRQLQMLGDKESAESLLIAALSADGAAAAARMAALEKIADAARKFCGGAALWRRVRTSGSKLRDAVDALGALEKGEQP